MEKNPKIIYQVWHLGLICLLIYGHFQNWEFTMEEMYCLPLLFIMLVSGLVFFYHQKINNRQLRGFRIFLIMLVELVVIFAIEVLILYHGWRVDSPPG